MIRLMALNTLSYIIMSTIIVIDLFQTFSNHCVLGSRFNIRLSFKAVKAVTKLRKLLCDRLYKGASCQFGRARVC